MTTQGWIAQNLSGAWTVMRGRADGLALLDLSVEGFWRSFGAVVLLVPFTVLGMLSQERLVVSLGESAGPTASTPLLAAAVALTADWIAFPLVFAALAKPFGLASRYVPYIVARNWAAVIISGLVAILHALHLVGVFPAGLMPFALLAALAVALRFSYVVARIALGAPMGVALPFVLLDLLVSFAIWGVFDRVA